MNIIKCWELKNCKEEIYEKCPAFISPNIPCWEIKGTPLNSTLSPSCSLCPVYLTYHNRQNLTKVETLRYHRQMLLDGWGVEKQKVLKKATVFLAGAGGLGSPVSFYLAEAGIGKLIICDFDNIELTNLNRQILHHDSRIGVNKSVSAKKTLTQLNPHLDVITITEQLTEENITRFIGDSNIIVDCLDNFPTRYVLNKYAVQNRIPLVFGAVYGLEGQLTFIAPPETVCLNCLYSESPPKHTFPVVGVTPAVIGSLQAMEVIKYLVGIGKNVKNQLLVFDGYNLDLKKFKLHKNPACTVCRVKRKK